MKLKIVGVEIDPKPDMEAFLHACFEGINRVLGLENVNSTVELHLYETLDGGDEGGGDANTDILHSDPYLVRMSAASPLRTMVNLAHEMIHVADLVKGRLVVTKEYHGKRAVVGRILYDGKEVGMAEQHAARNAGLDFIAMPYERTAYHGMIPVCRKVVEQFPSGARAYLLKHCPKTFQHFDEVESKLRKRSLEVQNEALKMGVSF